MNGGLRWHFFSASQLAAEVFAGLEAAIGQWLVIDVGKAQLQQGEGLAEWGAVVNDRVDHQCAVEIGVAAYHQITAFNQADVYLGWQCAA